MQIQSKLPVWFAKCCFSGKLTRHKVGCDKRFKEPKNQEPPHDWEPPAKIPKPINYASRVNPGASLLNRQHHQNTAILNQAARGALQVTILFNSIPFGENFVRKSFGYKNQHNWVLLFSKSPLFPKISLAKYMKFDQCLP